MSTQSPIADPPDHRPAPSRARNLARTSAQLLAAGLGLFCSVATSQMEPCEESTRALEWEQPGRSGRTPMSLLERVQAQDSLSLEWDGAGVYGEADLGLSMPATALILEVSADEDGGRDMERNGDCGSDGDGVETNVNVHAETSDGALYVDASAVVAEDQLSEDGIVLRLELDALERLDIGEIDPAGASLVDVRLDIHFADDGSASGRLVGRVEGADGAWIDDVQVATIASF